MLDPEDSRFLMTLIASMDAAHPEAVMLALVADRLRAEGGQMYLGGARWSLGAQNSQPTRLPDWLSGLRVGRVYTGDEVPALPAGDLRAIGLADKGLAPCWLILTRARSQFRAIDTARLAAYAPHLQQALTLVQRWAAQAAHERLQAVAARRMGVGLVELVGPQPRPDPVARDLLAAHGVSVADVARHWLQGAGANAASGETIVALAQGLDMLVLSAQGAQGAVGLLRAHAAPLPDAGLIAHALGITPAEARLARALAHGATVTQAALALGLTKQTAQFYSKQIFAKTGLSGQPALMRRIWTSALALAR